MNPNEKIEFSVLSDCSLLLFSKFLCFFLEKLEIGEREGFFVGIDDLILIFNFVLI